MDFSNYKEFKISNQKEGQNLMGEMIRYFGEVDKDAKGILSGAIRFKGKDFVRETFEQIKKTDCKDRLRLLIYKVKNCSVQLSTVEGVVEATGKV